MCSARELPGLKRECWSTLHFPTASLPCFRITPHHPRASLSHMLFPAAQVGVATDTARRLRAEQAMAKYQVGPRGGRRRGGQAGGVGSHAWRSTHRGQGGAGWLGGEGGQSVPGMYPPPRAGRPVGSPLPINCGDWPAGCLTAEPSGRLAGSHSRPSHTARHHACCRTWTSCTTTSRCEESHVREAVSRLQTVRRKMQA